MVTKRILLARHGQTEWNREGRQQSRLDSPLTELGRSQAHAVAELLQDFSPDGILVSPIGRARATAAIISAVLRAPVAVCKDLAELDLGEMSGLTRGEFEELYPGALHKRSQNWYHWQFPGGESYALAEARAAAVLKEVEAGGVERPVIVAHEMINRVLLKLLLDLDVPAVRRLSHPNDAVYEIRADTAEEPTLHYAQP